MDIFLSVLTGVVASFLVGVWLSHRQFKHSIAGYRVRQVVEATRAIVSFEGGYTGTLRNRYRYSLGVILDELHKTYGTTDAHNGHRLEWPLTINPSATEKDQHIDRWDRFNRYVRPVIEDINSYAFVAYILEFAPPLQNPNLMQQFRALHQLCIQLENVVSLLDDALQDEALREHIVVNEKSIAVKGIECAMNPKLRVLCDAQKDLHGAWTGWLKVTQETSS
jgi:hypothetical protein